MRFYYKHCDYSNCTASCMAELNFTKINVSLITNINIYIFNTEEWILKKMQKIFSAFWLCFAGQFCGLRGPDLALIEDLCSTTTVPATYPTLTQPEAENP